MEKRRIAILGSTGSIGRQALDVIRRHRDIFEVELLTANTSSALLIEQAVEFDANNVVICDESRYREVSDALSPHFVKVFAGMESVCDLVTSENVDIVLTALVGFSGLKPTVAAIKAGKIIALANKETLVAAGGIVTGLSAQYGAPVLPVDSEHSAIFQCLQGAYGPKWNMGSKVTVDSATMMNKGLEVIEAKWLFGVSPEDIKVVVHPQSVIHSMVEFEDGAVIAQLGHPDMREPIQYALSYPERLTLDNRKLDFAELGQLTFSDPDTDRFPALGLAYEAIRRGGNMPCIMNAANEVVVEAFLKDRIGFYDINRIIEETMDGADFVGEPDLDTIFMTNGEALAKAREILGKYLR